MKNKLLKSTLLLSLATPLVATISSCGTTSVQATTNSSQSNTVTKYTIKFNKGGADRIEGPTSVKAKKDSTFGSIEQPIAYKDNRPQSYWIDQNNNKVTDATVISGSLTLTPYFEADIQLKNCLSVIALEYTKFNVVHFGTNQTTTKPDLLYSTDGFKWQEFTGTTINIEPGSALYIRGTNPNGVNHDLYNYSQFSMAGTVHLNGSVMSLIDNGAGTATAIPNNYCFARLFEGCSGIKVISSAFLPATTLQSHCYESMFKNCSTLEQFPDYLLKASTLAEKCYADMFTNCTSLLSIPSGLLSYATTLSKECYFQMFRGCTGLTTIPDGTLPAGGTAGALAEGCYEGMFRECKNITTLGVNLLPATALQPYCYYGMFESCTGLSSLTVSSQKFKLPATAMANYSYKAMFYNCTSLTEAPALSATTLAEGCYYSMFYNCTALKAAPALGASKMAKECYAYMFYNCSNANFTQAPTLASTSLAEGCYHSMFYNCTSLTSAPALSATTMQPYCYAYMFYNCTALQNAPTMPTSGTVTLANYCCEFMFAYSGIKTSPELIATAAAEGCYRSMFSSCKSLTTINYIRLTSLANYACKMMFDSCSKVRIYLADRKEELGSTEFFKCPSTSGLTNPVDNMFQLTLGRENQGFEPDAGNYCGYTNS